MERDEIRLVAPDESLAEAVAAYYRRNRDFLRAFEPERDEAFYTEAHQREAIRSELRDREAGTAFRFYIQLAGTPGKVIGAIGLNNVVRGVFLSAFLGYKLDAAHLNRGYMSAAVGRTVRFAFDELQLHRIEANVMPRNGASLRVLEKNGFVNEGYSRAYLKINGVWEDHIHMVRLNDALR